MEDVYKRLALRLEQMPSGFPATEDGVELRLLEKVFAVREAEMALKIKPSGDTAEAVATRLEIPVEEARWILESMVKKGQLFCFKMFGRETYFLPPFVPGILEFQLDRLDKELAELIEEYRPALLKSLGSVAPPVFRVLPIQAAIDAKICIYPYEDVHLMIEQASAFNVMECICRKEHGLRGHACRHTSEVCLSFSSQPDMFDHYPLGRRISKQEALEVLAVAEKEGLVHNTFNVQQEPMFICNCCPCCCGILQAVKEADIPYMLATSSFVATINQETCARCGVCAEERCPMEAITRENGAYRVVPERCIGCGVCSPTCPTGSVSLVEKPRSQHVAPPTHLIEWNLARAASRGIELKWDSDADH